MNQIDKALYKLENVEHALTDIKSIVKWAADHKVALGEIVELLTDFDYYQTIEGENATFEDFEQFICDSLYEYKNFKAGEKK